jgi:hypothetical protein
MPEKMLRVNALIDVDRKKKLFHALVDEQISYSEWTRRMIDRYLAEQEAKAKRRRERR